MHLVNTRLYSVYAISWGFLCDFHLTDNCRTGVGRTGAFIAVDAMLERLTVVKTVDIFNYVSSMRHCRQNMVRTLVSTMAVMKTFNDYFVVEHVLQSSNHN